MRAKTCFTGAVFDFCHRILRGGIAVACLLSAASGAGQSQGTSLSQDAPERLNRISADLFSASPHLTDDVRELKEILAADTGNAQAHMLLGIAYRGLGSSEMLSEAVAELRQAIALNAGYVPARLYLAYIYLDIGRPQRASDELEAALQQSPGNPQLLSLQGEAQRQLKDPRRAIDLAEQSLKIDPSSAEAHYYLGLALFDLGKRPEAMKELEQVVASGQAAPDAYLSLGTLYVDAGRFDDAMKTLARGAAMDPSRADLHIQLARAYRSAGLLEKAANELRHARTKPGMPLAPSEFRQQQLEFDLALEQGALDLQRGRLTSAIAAFKKALTMDPASGQANRYLARIYLRKGSYATAAEYASRAEKAGAPLPAEEQKRLQEGLRKKR